MSSTNILNTNPFYVGERQTMAKTTTQQLDQALDATTNLVNASTVLTWVGVIFMVLVILGVVLGYSKRNQAKKASNPKSSMKQPTKADWIVASIILLVFIAAFIAVFIGASNL